MRAWSAAAEDKLRALYPTTPLPRLAFLLKRTPCAVKSRAGVLGLRRANGKVNWTRALDAKLRRLYADHSGQECAHALGVTLSALQNRVFARGLSKSAEWVAARARQRWAEGRHEGSRKGHYRKGHAPANKGRPQAEWMPTASRKRCQRTQFRKGERHGAAACNYVPVGTRKIRDGLLCVKLHDAGPYPAARWQPVHRLVWEAANGPVPAGHIAVFKPGKATIEEARITADRVEVITRAENMRRNSYHTRYPPEVRQVIQLAGALKRKINNRRKQHGNAQ